MSIPAPEPPATTTTFQVVPAHVVKSLDEWAAAIHADLDGAAQGLLSAGRHLMEAKVEHPGTFRAWLDSGGAGIKKSFAYMLMKIAEHPVSNMLDKVPSADVVSLYQLARLEPAQLEAAVEMDAVTPEMSRSEVKQYVDREMTHSKIKSRQQKTQDELEEITTYGKDAFVKAFNGGAFAGGITVDDFADKVLRRLSEDPDAAPTQEPGAFDPVKLGEAILKSVRPASAAPDTAHPAVDREPLYTCLRALGRMEEARRGVSTRSVGQCADGDPRASEYIARCQKVRRWLDALLKEMGVGAPPEVGSAVDPLPLPLGDMAKVLSAMLFHLEDVLAGGAKLSQPEKLNDFIALTGAIFGRLEYLEKEQEPPWYFFGEVLGKPIAPAEVQAWIGGDAE